MMFLNFLVFVFYFFLFPSSFKVPLVSSVFFLLALLAGLKLD